MSFLVQTSQDSDLIGLGRVCPEHLGFLKSSPDNLSGTLATQGSFILLRTVKREEEFKIMFLDLMFISMAAIDSLGFASRKLKKRNKINECVKTVLEITLKRCSNRLEGELEIKRPA